MITAYKNARLIDATGERLGSLYVEDALIRYAGPNQQLSFDREIDVGGHVLMPAFIDMHCHLRDPGYPQKETMETGMRAALSGGYATLCAMANTNPIMEHADQVQANLDKAAQLRLCKLIQAAAAGLGLKDEQPTDYAALSRVTNIISNDGNTIYSDEFMRNLLLASRMHGFLISTHCQPERKTVARDIALLRETGGNLHIGHISHGDTVGMVRAAKMEGLALTAEVTPHHLFGWDCDYRVNPPLRAEADVRALIEGIRDRTVDMLSTDHAPHTPADKQNNAAGISNIEHAAAIYMKVFHENGLPLTRFSEMIACAPAKRLGLTGGLLAAGCPADLVILDVEEEWTIVPENMVSRSHNTPFAGRTVRGRVLRTIVEGECRYDRSTVQ